MCQEYTKKELFLMFKLKLGSVRIYGTENFILTLKSIDAVNVGVVQEGKFFLQFLSLDMLEETVEELSNSDEFFLIEKYTGIKYREFTSEKYFPLNYTANDLYWEYKLTNEEFQKCDWQEEYFSYLNMDREKELSLTA